MIEYPIWPYVPDFSTVPTESRTATPDQQSLGAGPDFVAFPLTRSERTFKLGFAWDTPRDWHAAKALWQSFGGRACVFLVPTWARDFNVTAQPTAGDYELVVNVADYGATYLTTTALDEVGRYLFCWDQLGGLHVAKVLSSADGATSTLTLEQAFPFTPTREAIYGFAVLARFGEDESEWMNTGPNRVKVALVFQSILERMIYAATGPLDGIDQYQSLGFLEGVQTFEDTPQFFRVASCLGPKNLHVAQNADYTHTWYIWLSTTGGFRLVRDPITPPTYPDEAQGIKSTLVSGIIPTEHVTCCFDQVGWECIAWAEGSLVKMARRQNGTATVTSWTGTSPCLFWNGEVNVQARIDGTTDVVCYYIKPGSGALFARFQRDNFAIEYSLGGYPTVPLNLVRCERDGLVHNLYAVDVGYRSMVLSVTYPTQPDPLPDPYVALELDGEAVGGFVTPGDIAYENGIISEAIAEDAGGAGAVVDIENANVAPPPTNFAEAEIAKAFVLDLAYEVIIFGPPVQTAAAGARGSVPDITSVLVAIETSKITEETGAKGAVSDIYYGP